MDMEAKDLLDRMTDENAAVPFVRDVTAGYAMRLAAIADKLTAQELDSMVEIGRVIDRRTTRLVPVISEDQIDAWLSGTPVHPRTSSSGGLPG